jgi:hypothetical protein
MSVAPHCDHAGHGPSQSIEVNPQFSGCVTRREDHCCQYPTAR